MTYEIFKTAFIESFENVNDYNFYFCPNNLCLDNEFLFCKKSDFIANTYIRAMTFFDLSTFASFLKKEVTKIGYVVAVNTDVITITYKITDNKTRLFTVYGDTEDDDDDGDLYDF